jgi:hypothetical protein
MVNERQMYGQWNHCAIHESDLQRLCSHTGLGEMAHAIERLDREVAAIKRTVDRILHKVRFPISEARHCYEVRPRKDHRVGDLISDALPFR